MQHPHRHIINWLYVIMAMILLMVLIGGLTRLTGSGLSITVWKPLAGAIPPLNLQDWQAEFLAYQQIPQFSLQNPLMTLDEFKTIYWWEWSHRQIGRILGFVFLIPLLNFWAQGKIPKGYKIILMLVLLGGAFQGFLGWYMVSSGLSARTEVSQYRLAIHLIFALLLYLFILKVIFCLKKNKSFTFKIPLRSGLLTLFILLQIISGAFMAGTHSGYIYNDWPLLDGAIIPKNLFPQGIMSLFENHLTIQFFHRMGAYFILSYGLYIWWMDMRFLPKDKSIFFLFSLFTPVIIGIITLITVAPLEHIEIAALHQISAVFLLSISFIYIHYLKI